MAQTGYTPILLYGSTSAGNTPSSSNLTTGVRGVELAVNATDGKLFYKDDGGTVQVLATKAAAAGTFSSVNITGGTISNVTITGGSISGITDLAVADGGTGASTASGARANLSAAQSGANSDITSLSGLTTALSVAQGGTGVTTSTGSGSVVLSSSPALTGVPTAPTATGGTNTTQLATTEFVTAAISSAVTATIQAAYPVGSIYYNASNSTNPATLLGFGTWTAIGAGRMLVGYSSGDPLFGTAGNTGGSRDATLVSHNHSATSSVTDPGHNHLASGQTPNVVVSGISFLFNGSGSQGYASLQPAVTGISVATSIASAGSSGTNANLPPYLVVYIWQRTA